MKWKKEESRLLSDVLSELLSTVLIHLDMNFGAEIPLLNRLTYIHSTDRTLQRLLPPEPTILLLTIKNISREARKMGDGAKNCRDLESELTLEAFVGSLNERFQ